MKLAGIWLRTDVFTHGQLYVACSRVGHPDKLKFAVKVESDGRVKAVPNVVYREILLDNDM